MQQSPLLQVSPQSISPLWQVIPDELEELLELVCELHTLLEKIKSLEIKLFS